MVLAEQQLYLGFNPLFLLFKNVLLKQMVATGCF